MSLFGVRFTAQVTAGNLITAMTVIIAAFGVYKDMSSTVAQNDRDLAVHEARITDNTNRLNAATVAQAEITVKLANLQDLMREVRDELKTSNREGRP